MPVTTAISPVRPPMATPEALSMKLVVLEVPSTAPTTVAPLFGKQRLFQVGNFAVLDQSATFGNANQRAGGVK